MKVDFVGFVIFCCHLFCVLPRCFQNALALNVSDLSGQLF